MQYCPINVNPAAGLRIRLYYPQPERLDLFSRDETLLLVRAPVGAGERLQRAAFPTEHTWRAERYRLSLHHVILKLLFSTGMRPCEIVGLERQDVDHEQLKLRVRAKLRDGARTNADFGLRSGPRTDGVVAQRLDLMRFKGDGSELSVGYFDALRVFPVDELCGHAQPGVGGGGTDVVEDRPVAAQRVAGPVLADLAEQAMVDGVPLGGAAGVVTNGDLEVVRVGEAGLECILEATDAWGVAAAGIGEHQQL